MNWDRVLYPLDLVGCNLIGRRFVGAFSVEGVLDRGRELREQGFGVTYNLLGEHVHDQVVVAKAVETTLRLLDAMNAMDSGNISCKPTLYGLSVSKDLFIHNIGVIIDKAVEKGIEVEFDAENYSHIADTFKVFSSFASQRVYNNTVRQAVQAHLKDINGLMNKYGLFDKNIRIVKGAGVYNEADKSVIEDDPAMIRSRYFEILGKNILNNRKPYVATVRDKQLAGIASSLGNDLFEFQRLYGPIGKKLGFYLLRLGYPVRVYVPFTDHWCRNEWKAYGLRRAKMMRSLLLKSLLKST